MTCWRKRIGADALAAYEVAAGLHETSPALKGRAELDGDRASLAMNRGVCLDRLGRLDEALAAFGSAIALWEARSETAALPEQISLAKACANASELLAAMPDRDAHAWAREKSARLIGMVDLVERQETRVSPA